MTIKYFGAVMLGNETCLVHASSKASAVKQLNTELHWLQTHAPELDTEDQIPYVCLYEVGKDIAVVKQTITVEIDSE